MEVAEALRALAAGGAVVRFVVAPEEPAVRVTLACRHAADERVTAVNVLGDGDVVAVLLATAQEVLAEVRAVEARRVLRVVG